VPPGACCYWNPGHYPAFTCSCYGGVVYSPNVCFVQVLLVYSDSDFTVFTVVMVMVVVHWQVPEDHAAGGYIADSPRPRQCRHPAHGPRIWPTGALTERF
jgi:hypothetical protein